MAAIPLIGFLLFSMLPLILATIVSFTELHSTNLADMKWVGLKNYITILTNADDHTYASYWTTIVYALNAPICIAIALYIANLLNRVRVGKRFFRSVFFIPYVCSTVTVALIFRILYAGEGGALNSIWNALGFGNVEWLTSTPTMFMVSTIIMSVWKGLGFCIVLYLASLSKVDANYYEAAKIDGASSFQIFWKVTWPAVSPITAYLLTMKLIWALQAMAETYVLVERKGVVPTWGNSDAWVSDTVVTHIYNMVFVRPYQEGYGLAAAAGWILAIIVFVVTRLNLKWQKRWVNYDF